MRAPLPLLILAFAGGLVAACVDETPPDDLDLANDGANNVDEKKKPGAPPKSTTNPLPGGNQPPPSGSAPTQPDAGGGGTGPSAQDSGASTRPSTDAGTTPAPMTPFKRIDVRYPVDTGLYITQCTLDGKTQLVWKTLATGTDANARFADPAYYQQPNVFGGCGTKVSGEYPLVFTQLADGDLPTGTYLAKCAAPGTAHVYRVSGALEGHPAATYGYSEAHAACP